MAICEAMPTRSKPSVPMATIQPAPSSPRRHAAGMRTSVKKISLNSSSPAMSRIGRTSIPGVFRLRTKAVMPSCFFPRSIAVGSVRSRNSPHVARWAEEIQIFEPLTTYSSVSGS